MYSFIESIFTASTPSEARQALMIFINFTVAVIFIAGGITFFARNVKSIIVKAVLNVTSILISFVPIYTVIDNFFNLNGELDIPLTSRISLGSGILLMLMKLMSILILMLISIIPIFSNPLSGIKSLSEVEAEEAEKAEEGEKAEKRIEAQKQAEKRIEAQKQAEEEAKRQQERAEKQAKDEAKRKQEQAEKQAMADLIAESIIKKMKADGLATISLTKESLTESTAE